MSDSAFRSSSFEDNEYGLTMLGRHAERSNGPSEVHYVGISWPCNTLRIILPPQSASDLSHEAC